MMVRPSTLSCFTSCRYSTHTGSLGLVALHFQEPRNISLDFSVLLSIITDCSSYLALTSLTLLRSFMLLVTTTTSSMTAGPFSTWATL